MQQALSVEIFRDTDSRELNTDIADHGIDLIRRQSVGLEIVRRTRLLRLATDTDEPIAIDTFRWPRLDADINVILTTRELVRSSPTITDRTLGYAALTKGIAVVAQNEHSHTTVAHETGHLLGLKRSGRTFDDESHCIDPLCLMHRYGASTEESVRIKKRGINAWLERRGYVPAEYEAVKAPTTESFCDECANQLGHNAFWLLKHKSGESIPNDLLDLTYRE